MNSVIDQPAKIIPGLICALPPLGSPSGLRAAQEPPAFEISITNAGGDNCAYGRPATRPPCAHATTGQAGHRPTGHFFGSNRHLCQHRLARRGDVTLANDWYRPYLVRETPVKPNVWVCSEGKVS